MITMNRRAFLRNVSIAGGGVMLGVTLGGCGGEVAPWPNQAAGVLQPNAFLQVRPDGSVVLAVHKAEMGQGVATGLATLVAEELEIDPLRLQIEFAEPHPDYNDKEYRSMITGGSASMRNNFDGMREAGAALREMLRQAAAATWGAALADCIAADGAVSLRDGSRSASYGDLATAAAKLPVPADIALKPASQWRRIGKHDARVDAVSKVDGSAQFALDLSLPGMLTAVLVRCPHFGGTLKGFKADRAQAVAGVRKVLEIDGAVAVVADGYWQASSAAALLEIEWDKGPLAGLDSAAITAAQRRLLAEETGRVVREDGEAPPADAVARSVSAEYRVPYLAHAPMEPMNAVASVTAEGAEVWAGNQAPDVLKSLVARRLEIAPEKVRVHSTYLGGAFGRRTYMEFALEAVALSRATGAPVKVVWSREDDMRHDHYRPAAMAAMRADIGADGKLLGWDARVVAPPVMNTLVGVVLPVMLPRWAPLGVGAAVEPLVAKYDPNLTEGVDSLPYALPYVRVEGLVSDPGIPVGVWRSVGHSQNAFFSECFVDEVAHALGQDPVRFRLERLPADSPVRSALELLVARGGWGSAPEGVYQGIAVHQSFGTVVAEQAEVVIEDGRPRLRRVVCAVECGVAVNPDVVRMQVESAVVFALSAALHGEITIRDGAVEQGNFDAYPVLRIDGCPEIEVHIVASERPPSGIGEPGVPPLAPALANAIFAATGERLRELPLRLS